MASELNMVWLQPHGAVFCPYLSTKLVRALTNWFVEIGVAA